VLESSFVGAYTQVLSCFQCDGIPLGKTTTSMIQPIGVLLRTLLSYSNSYPPSIHPDPPTNLHLFLSLLWILSPCYHVVALLNDNGGKSRFLKTKVPTTRAIYQCCDTCVAFRHTDSKCKFPSTSGRIQLFSSTDASRYHLIPYVRYADS
jgi:hypothetical protein